MKREHAISNPLVDFLEAHNCLFYSPLSHDDTTDWISGNNIEFTNSVNKQWDNDNLIWKLSKISNNPAYYARCELFTPIQASIPLEITGVGEFISYTQSDANPNVWDFTPNMYGFALSGTKDVITQSAQTFPIINGSSWQYVYRNGEQIGNLNYNSILYTRYNAHIMFGWVNRNFTFGLRNFACFLSALSLNEINEYFNIITV